MKRKYEFNNVNSLDTFNDINGEISVKYPEVKFNVNYEKFYFLIESDNDDFDFNNYEYELFQEAAYSQGGKGTVPAFTGYYRP